MAASKSAAADPIGDPAIEPAEDRALREAFGRLGQDTEATDVNFALDAQREALISARR
jgi:hypothetical protein